MNKDALHTALRQGQDAWPTLEVNPEQFEQYLLERIESEAGNSSEGGADVSDADAGSAGGGSSSDAQLNGLCLPDLYLACACAHKSVAALRLFEQHYVPVMEMAVASMDKGTGLKDEVKQIVRDIVFVGTSTRRPAIEDYSGKGNLRAWVRIIAVREGLRILRKSQGRVDTEDDSMLDLLIESDDPEVQLLKSRYREVFGTAFRQAIRELPRRERTALRLHLLDGLSIDEIGPMFRVHRATAARWLVRARENLLQGTRQIMMTQLKISEDEVDSILRFIQTNLDMTLSSALRTRT